MSVLAAGAHAALARQAHAASKPTRIAAAAAACTSQGSKLGVQAVQQRAVAEREAEQQPLDSDCVVTGGAWIQAADSDGVPGRARGALDELDGERGRDGEEQAAQPAGRRLGCGWWASG